MTLTFFQVESSLGAEAGVGGWQAFLHASG
jgi:hypothetical protein